LQRLIQSLHVLVVAVPIGVGSGGSGGAPAPPIDMNVSPREKISGKNFFGQFLLTPPWAKVM